MSRAHAAKIYGGGGDGDYLGRNDGVCVTEDRYEYFLSAWGVGYTADGRAVSKYHYFSE